MFAWFWALNIRIFLLASTPMLLRNASPGLCIILARAHTVFAMLRAVNLSTLKSATQRSVCHGVLLQLCCQLWRLEHMCPYNVILFTACSSQCMMTPIASAWKQPSRHDYAACCPIVGVDPPSCLKTIMWASQSNMQAMPLSVQTANTSFCKILQIWPSCASSKQESW